LIVRTTPLRPNHVTLIGTAIGLAGAALLARGTYAAGVCGTLLFVVAAIVDGCDGEVARLTFRESAFGQKLDVTTDNVVHLAIFVALAIGLQRRAPDGHVAALTALLLGGFALDGALSYYFLVVRTDWRARSSAAVSWRARARDRILHGLEALMNRDFAYLLALLAVIDRLHWFLWGAALGSWAFAALFVLAYATGSAVAEEHALAR
jgi:phosphatidylglycerophosphate synthase